MKRQSLFYLLLLLLMSPVYADAATARNLTPPEAYSLVNQRSDLYLLDVRTFGEYQQARIEGSRLIPIDQFITRLQEVPKNRPILVYCAVGSRSAQVVNFLARKGYPEIYNMNGGIYAWAQKGFPVLRGGP